MSRLIGWFFKVLYVRILNHSFDNVGTNSLTSVTLPNLTRSPSLRFLRDMIYRSSSFVDCYIFHVIQFLYYLCRNIHLHVDILALSLPKYATFRIYELLSQSYLLYHNLLWTDNNSGMLTKPGNNSSSRHEPQEVARAWGYSHLPDWG